MQVYLNVYDVSNAQAQEAADKSSDTIVKLNNITRQLGIGGVFHGGVEIHEYGSEWSFGYCERGTGVYRCQPKKNPMYVYREQIDLGVTLKTKQEVENILRTMKQTWPGLSYDLLSRNCCHFCDELCKQLGVKPVPGWLNRFAQSADATVTLANEAVVAMRNLSEGISRSAQSSVTWVRDSWQRMVVTSQQSQSSPGPSPRSTQNLFPSTSGSAPSSRPSSARVSGWFKDVAERFGGVSSNQPVTGAPSSSPPSFNITPSAAPMEQMPFSRSRSNSSCSTEFSASTPPAASRPNAINMPDSERLSLQSPGPDPVGVSADVHVVYTSAVMQSGLPKSGTAIAPPAVSLI